MPAATRHVQTDLDRFLGWFSVGLGLAELLAPDAVAAASGVRSRGLLRLYGVREIAVGVGLLRGGNPAPWLWARVAGDGMDLGTVAAGLADADTAGPACATAAVLAGVAALDLAAARAADARTLPVGRL